MAANISEQQKLENLIKKSQNVLFEASSIALFDLFPDKLVIDENKINILTREFIESERIYSIPISKVVDVEVETTPFSATLKITHGDFKEQPVIIKDLDPDKAIKARRIIQGLIIGQGEQIDFSKIKTKDLVKKLEELGKTTET